MMQHICAQLQAVVSTVYVYTDKDWIGLSSVLRHRQHSIGYMGDGFYRSKDPTKIRYLMIEQKFSSNEPACNTIY